MTIELTKEDEKVINRITNKLYKDGSEIMSNGCKKMANAERIMIEHHDGVIKFNEWGYAQCFSRSKATSLIRTWYNQTYTKKEIYEQIKQFVLKCKEDNLEIKFCGSI